MSNSNQTVDNKTITVFSKPDSNINLLSMPIKPIEPSTSFGYPYNSTQTSNTRPLIRPL